MIFVPAMLLQIAGQLPDLELSFGVRARSVTIEKKGEASLTVSTSPDGGKNVLEVRAPKANGRKTLRNVAVDVRAQALIAEPVTQASQNKSSFETTQPQ